VLLAFLEPTADKKLFVMWLHLTGHNKHRTTFRMRVFMLSYWRISGPCCPHGQMQAAWTTETLIPTTTLHSVTVKKTSTCNVQKTALGSENKLISWNVSLVLASCYWFSFHTCAEFRS